MALSSISCQGLCLIKQNAHLRYQFVDQYRRLATRGIFKKLKLAKFPQLEAVRFNLSSVEIANIGLETSDSIGWPYFLQSNSISAKKSL